MTLEIRLLGELEVRSAGQIVRLPPSRKTRALLGYLATTGRAHLREHLCDLFWDRPNDPRAALRWSLSKLRPLLDTDGSTRLITTHDHVGIDPAAVWTDLSAIRSGLTRSIESIPTDVLHACSADFRGDFLEALSLPDLFRYHTWWLAEREAARRLHVRILAELVDRHAADPATALPYAREWSAVEPASEAAHGVVMRMLAGLGRVSEALEQYEICRSILARELAVGPSAELERLRRQLRPGRGEAGSDTGSAYRLSIEDHYRGEWGEGENHYRQAVALARREGERWWECFLLTQLVMMAIERGDGHTARDRCRELIPVTRRLGEGSEGPFAAALASLACYDPEEADSVAELDRGVSHLRRLDSKWMVAYIQTLAAERDLQAESTSRAAARAREALRCADAVSRASDAAHARAVLAACSVAAGDPASAAEHLIALERGDRARSPLSARARAAIASAHARLAKAVSTADPTPVPTSPA